MGTDLVPFSAPDHADEPDVAGMLRAWDRAEFASRILKTSILLAAAGAIVFALLWAGNPLVLLTKAKASLVATSAPQEDTVAPPPIIQSTADRQVLPTTTTDEPKGGDMTSPREAADQSHTEIRQQPAEDVLGQFQAWAAEQDAREKLAPVEPVVPVESAMPVEPVLAAQDSQTLVAQDAGPPVRHVRRHRPIHPLQNARAEIRPVQNTRAMARPAKMPKQIRGVQPRSEETSRRAIVD
jgi:hypothetical protein